MSLLFGYTCSRDQVCQRRGHLYIVIGTVVVEKYNGQSNGGGLMKCALLPKLINHKRGSETVGDSKIGFEIKNRFLFIIMVGQL